MTNLPSAVAHQWLWPDNTAFTSTADGLINDTFMARGSSGLIGVVQRLNTDIFVPEVHEDIEAVTQHLQSRGVLTPRLVRTRDDALYATLPSGVWRRLSAVGDTTLHRLASPEQAQRAGELVGRFHRGLQGLSWRFRSVRPGAHDTRAHLTAMHDAKQRHGQHRLYEQVAPLIDEIAVHYAQWQGHDDLPQRIIHGDLKVSNLRWSGQEAVAVIDLDTLQHGTLAVELGDALRSWCNTASEDSVVAQFDVALFAAAMRGYRTQASPTAEELDAVLPGVDRIATELAARFAKDALDESYFGFNPRFGTRGEHNLLRARGQLSLARAVRGSASAVYAATRQGE